MVRRGHEQWERQIRAIEQAKQRGGNAAVARFEADLRMIAEPCCGGLCLI
jgi:hypothetical protein